MQPLPSFRSLALWFGLVALLASHAPLISHVESAESASRQLHVVFIIGENEYNTWETLPEFAEKDLRPQGLRFSYVKATPLQNDNEFTNIVAIKEADLLVVSVRRRTPRKEMLDLVRAHLAAGKPLVGIRTASHAWDAKPVDAEHDNWPTFDVDILGAKYENHYGRTNLGPQATITAVPEATTHPVLRGVPIEFASDSHLYKYRKTGGTVTPLLTGHLVGRTNVEMAAWSYTGNNRRVFYTSLGGPEDFKLPAFRILLRNAVLWALDRPIPLADFKSDWSPMTVPGTWEDNSRGALAQYDGFAWYRCAVMIPASWRGKDTELFIESVDNAYEAYANGTKIGTAGKLPPNYENGDTAVSRHKIKASDLRAGEVNWIAVRVYDAGGRGGFKGKAPSLVAADEAIHLEGDWQFRTGDDSTWSKPPSDFPPNLVAFSKIIDSANIARSTFAHQPQEAPLTPEESMQKFHVPDDLEIEQVLAEPIVAQPVFLNFDERGRMWVVQYRQYPFPAGLKMMSRDNVWRAVYDKVPPPPPHHFRGEDKITIHEDTDGDGKFDKHTTFVEGLNICTAVERGR